MGSNQSTDRTPVPATPVRRLAVMLLLLLVLLGVVLVMTPAMVIQPFKPQTPRGVAISYAMKSWSPALTFLFSIVAILLVAWLWRGMRWWRKALLIPVVLVLFGFTWLARQNHFEWMFNPLHNSQYAAAANDRFLTPDDLVLSVTRNGEAVAYPVRIMAYHHIAQDVVGGIPITATY
jgi:uncharacterized BrkB/YihY/UPF0761 family membrane protein